MIKELLMANQTFLAKIFGMGDDESFHSGRLQQVYNYWNTSIATLQVLVTPGNTADTFMYSRPTNLVIIHNTSLNK